jgi:hypothetical protein
MKRNLLLLIVIGLLLFALTGNAIAGVEPSPFQPQINKLNSIQLSIAFIQKSLGRLVVSKSLPIGSKAVLLGIRYNLASLDSQLAEVLSGLPPYSELGDSQNGVYYALEGLRLFALGMEDPLAYILERMGIEPSPFKKSLDSISNRVGDYSGVCTPGTVCPRP